MPLKKFIFLFLISIFSFEQSFADIKIAGKFKNWESHYTEDGKDLICFALSIPTKMEPKNLNRAEARLFVTFRTKDNTQDEVSITGGYPYKKGAKVNLTISNSSFGFESSENFAWLPSKDQEIKLVSIMKKKNDAQVVGLSSRGNKTTDTYSLLGFTDAYNSAKNKCKK